MAASKVRERQLTFANHGHMLNHRQAISPDGCWAVYDSRNEDAHIARTDTIELVQIDSCEILKIYKTPTQTNYGPGVGAAAFHPHDLRVVFIHGLESCSIENPYSAARRFGAIVGIDAPGKFVHAEARSIQRAEGQRVRASGALSGGTHAHSWNHDGWLSFTYNDAWLERVARTDPRVRDRRTIGFMVPGLSIAIEDNDGEDFSGSFGAFLAANVCQSVRNGSDDIEQAVEECWIGTNGYVDHLGQHHAYALACLGAVRNDDGTLVNEIFICDLLGAIELSETFARPDKIGPNELLNPMVGCKQRRLTRTFDRKFPGVQGPRNWLISSPDGKHLYAPMRDERGVAQLFRVSTSSGVVEQITDLEQSIEGQISLDVKGKACSFICDQRICVVDVATGQVAWLTDKLENPLCGAIHFVGDQKLVFNRYVGTGRDRFLQVFIGDRG